jgi:hypothetical protein
VAARNNHWTRLREENDDLKQRLADVEQWVTDFRTHLQSGKFHQDTTIQVRDVDNRLIDLLEIRHGFVQQAPGQENE